MGYSIVLAFSFGVLSFASPYNGSKFSDVWTTVSSGPYKILPKYTVTLGSITGGLFSNPILAAAKKTLTEEDDVRPAFQKLVHANGVCFAGTWNITEKSPYSGYFATGKNGLIIARASVAMSDTEAGTIRAFGLAGKIFPTENPRDQRQLKTANFFTIEDLGGSDTLHFTDAAFTNEPPLTKRLNGISIGLAIATAFNRADSRPNLRQLYPISELGLADKSKAVTPLWMALKARPGQLKDSVSDFRKELLLSNTNGPLVFDINVSSSADAGWTRIGNIKLTEDALSAGCDHQLHFAHPKHRAILR